MLKSKKSISIQIDEAEKVYEWCWEQLRGGSSQKPALPLLTEFQPRLLDTLFKVDKAYRECVVESRSLIQRKETLSAEYFRLRMRVLDSYKQALMHTIGVGRAIGDGFAWIFYRNSRRLLDEHLGLPVQKLMSPGIGGIGERQIVQHIQGIGRYFVISHAITSILRLGDVSLYDPDADEIVALAEIKTLLSGHKKLQSTLNFIAGKETVDRLVSSVPAQPGEEALALPEPLKQRLDRQSKQMTKALDDANKDIQKAQLERKESDFYFEELKHSLRRGGSRKFSYVVAGKEMIIAGIRPILKSSLSATLLGTNKFNPTRADGIEVLIEDIMKTGSPHNSITIGDIAYRRDGMPLTSAGTIPAVFWPLSSEVIKNIIFHRVFAMTFYNHAHLIAKLEHLGFVVSVSSDRKKISAKMNFEKGHLEIANLEYFRRYTVNFLMSSNAVAAMVDKSIEAAKTGQYKSIAIRPMIH